jgi:SAM-dependent methyltransferase
MSTHKPKEFYSNLADFYDQMTDLNTRLQKWESVFRQFFDTYPSNSVLDIGCGTGIHLMVLRRLGIPAIGMDISISMLQKARNHFQTYQYKIPIFAADLSNIPLKRESYFDTIICLGNTIPHITEPKILERIFKEHGQLLHSGGILVLQLLNYTRILKQRKRLIKATHSPDRSMIRFYDFLDPLLQFNVVEIKQEGHVNWNSVPLYPYQYHELQEYLQMAGFSIIEFYSSLTMQPFDPHISNDLVVVARL